MENAKLVVLYAFYGGKLDGEQFPREAVEAMCDGHTPDRSKERQMGCLCPRKELDNQPTVDGYCGPMWDGQRYVLEDGSMKYDYEIFDKRNIRYTIAVLRYETPEFYEAMSI